MRDSLLDHVVRISLLVADVQEQIEETSATAPEPGNFRPQLIHLLRELRSRNRKLDELAIVEPALIYWVDDILSHADWPHSEAWREHSLEQELLQSDTGAWNFFSLPDAARELDTTVTWDVLRMCVALGFQGVLRTAANIPNPEAAMVAASLPPTIEEWAAAQLGMEFEQPDTVPLPAGMGLAKAMQWLLMIGGAATRAFR